MDEASPPVYLPPPVGMPVPVDQTTQGESESLTFEDYARFRVTHGEIKEGF